MTSDVSAPSVLGRRWRTPAGGGEGAVRGAEGGSAHAPRRILFPSPPIRLGMRNLASGGGVGACWEGRSRWSGKPPTPLHSGLHTQSHPHAGPSADTWFPVLVVTTEGMWGWQWRHTPRHKSREITPSRRGVGVACGEISSPGTHRLS